MIGNSLAIVIPAYKASFFRYALSSIADQTCKRFRVYIGDDASPQDLYSIVRDFEDRINISYVRFEENLGGRDLVAQWERCVDLVGEEEWIWLFSDDDIMAFDCVDLFYKQLERRENYDLYHFNVNVIDDNGKLVRNGSVFPEIYPVRMFLENRLKHGETCFVVEFIFKKTVYKEKGGFQKFDLAWGSDVATWAKIAGDKGIYTIENAVVSWRKSSENISPDRSKNIQIRKLYAFTEFLVWLNSSFNDDENLAASIRIGLLNRLKSSCDSLSLVDILHIINLYSKRLQNTGNAIYLLFYMSVYCMYYKLNKRFPSI